MYVLLWECNDFAPWRVQDHSQPKPGLTKRRILGIASAHVNELRTREKYDRMDHTRKRVWNMMRVVRAGSGGASGRQGVGRRSRLDVGGPRLLLKDGIVSQTFALALLAIATGRMAFVTL